jgi:Cu/Ag efflux protein CusF
MDVHRHHALLVITSLMLAGCAGYQLEPLAASHPAYPGAAAAPARPRAQTLAYTQSDIPSVPSVPAVAATHHERPATRPPEGRPPQTVVGEGQVVATVQSSGQIVVEHGEIKGFMEAMTMGYRVDPPSLLEDVKPGDTVRFTIDVQRRAIVVLERLR